MGAKPLPFGRSSSEVFGQIIFRDLGVPSNRTVVGPQR